MTVGRTHHAASATIALVAAVLALRGRRRALRVLVPSLVAMEGALVGAVVAGWDGYGRPLQVVFTALLVLGGVVVGRGVEAARHAPGTERRRSALVFVTIALVDAFLVVAVLDLGGPVWAQVATGVVVAVAGHVLLGRDGPQGRRRSSASSSSTSATSSAPSST